MACRSDSARHQHRLPSRRQRSRMRQEQLRPSAQNNRSSLAQRSKPFLDGVACGSSGMDSEALSPNKSVESLKRKLLAANKYSAGSFRWSARRDTHISTCFFKPPKTMPQLLSQCAFLSSAQYAL